MEPKVLQQKSRKSWQTSCSARYVAIFFFGLISSSLFLSVSFFIILCHVPQIGAVCSSYFSADLTFQVGEVWVSFGHETTASFYKHLTLHHLFDSGHRCHRKTLRADAGWEIKSMYTSLSGLTLWDCLDVTIFTLMFSQELQVRENSKRVTSTHLCHYFPWSCLIKKNRNTIFQICVGLAVTHPINCTQVSEHF